MKLISVEGADHYLAWPQTVIPFGDGWAVAHLIRREDVIYPSDQGDIQVTVLDSNLDLVQSVTVAEASEGLGAHRPGLARLGDELLVSFEEEVQPRLVVLQLDPEFPPEPDPETGLPGFMDAPEDDPGSPGDSGLGEDSGSPAPAEPDEGAVEHPTADAGRDLQTVMGEPIRLDGRQSTGPAGTELSYIWTVAEPSVLLPEPDASVVVFDPPAPGVYTFSLVVSAAGVSASDSVTVTVLAPSGCGCTTGSPARVAWLALLAVGVVGRRFRST